MTADDTRLCPHCGAPQRTFFDAGYRPVYLWRECSCEAERGRAAAERVRHMEAMKQQQHADSLLRACGLDRIAALTLDRFMPQRLASVAGAHPYAIACGWLAAIADERKADYDALSGPPCALYFYSPSKGAGKTHLAAALALEARRLGRLVAYVEENSYLDRLWACPFAEREELLQIPGERAWLSVLDDLGQRGRASEAVSDAWYSLVNRRWLARGFTIITSNYTLEELAQRGTINDATYSRLAHMTRREYIHFNAADSRLAQISNDNAGAA